MLTRARSRAFRPVALALLAIAGPLVAPVASAGAVPVARAGPVTAAVTGALATPATVATPAGVSVPAPPSDVTKVRAAQMPVLEQIDAPAAWQFSQGSKVTVAVLDTGVDATAPDLAGKVTTGPDYAAGVDPPGYKPPLMHGTYIASLIAGHGRGPGDTEGVIGVAPKASILAVRVIPDDTEPGIKAYNGNSAYADAIAQGINYAVKYGATVINLSLSAQAPTAALRAALANAYLRGVVVVASVGNGGTTGSFAPYLYPASFPGVLAVAAVTSAGARASFSQQNSSVVVSAPGVDVIGAGPGGKYIAGDGTSPAAALVSGVAALILAKYPALPPSVVEQSIITTTTHRPVAGYSVDTGFGEVDAAAALAAAATYVSQDADGPDNADGGTPDSNLSDKGGMTAAVSIPGLSQIANPRSQLARSPAPIVVTHRDEARVMAYGLIATAAAVLAAIALAAMIVFSRRPKPLPAGREMADMPPGDDLIN
jgi:subtilisin family serine protease